MTSTRRYRVPGVPGLAVGVLDIGLACCSLEIGAAITAGLLEPADDDLIEASVLLVSGTVTDAMAPAVLAAWNELPEPRRAVSFGACANTGGPYWDAPTVLKGVDQVIAIEVYVPGCPPRPEALIAGLSELVAR
jgi:NADH-quinone oxidoreductase subunit B